ncbi:hypothetical protein C2W62_52080, partial [Candidatus Entotheonella serta]
GIRDGGDTLIANTGSIPAGSEARVFADVSIPAGFAAGAVDIFFRALSPTSGTSDIIHDAVLVATERSITINPASGAAANSTTVQPSKINPNPALATHSRHAAKTGNMHRSRPLPCVIYSSHLRLE